MSLVRGLYWIPDLHTAPTGCWFLNFFCLMSNKVHYIHLPLWSMFKLWLKCKVGTDVLHPCLFLTLNPPKFIFSPSSSASLTPAGDPDGDFHLQTDTGALSTSRSLDREKKAAYTIEVVATDRGSPALSSVVTVEVKVLDVNDNSPVFSKNSYSVEVTEDAAEGSQVLKVRKEC